MGDRMIQLIDFTAHSTFHLIKDDAFKLRFIILIQLNADTFLRKV